MAAIKTRKAPKEAPEEKPVPLPTNITEQEVLAKLGKPLDLCGVDVYRYGTSRCRVNIRRELTKAAAVEHFHLCRTKEADYKGIVEGADHSISKTIRLITDSFYLRTNYDGSLRSDSDPIERKY